MGNLLCGTDGMEDVMFFVPVPDAARGGREKTVEASQLSGDNLVIFRRRVSGVVAKRFFVA